MKKANEINEAKEGDTEVMSDSTLQKLIEYLKSVGWSDSDIVKLLEYISK